MNESNAMALADNAMGAVDWNALHARSRAIFDAVHRGSSLALQSGLYGAPPVDPAQAAMDRYKQQMPPQQVRGPIETITDALDPHKPWTAGGALNALMMAIPGTPRVTGTIPKGPKFQANNYAEPPTAANAVPAHEVTRLQKQLGRMLPITAENETEAMAIRAQIRKLDEVHDAAYWGRAPTSKPNPLTTDLDELYGAPSLQERARLLGIRAVEPPAPDGK